MRRGRGKSKRENCLESPGLQLPTLCRFVFSSGKRILSCFPPLFSPLSSPNKIGRGALLGGTGGDIVPTTASGGAVMALRGVAEVRERTERVKSLMKSIDWKIDCALLLGSLLPLLCVVSRSGAVVRAEPCRSRPSRGNNKQIDGQTAARTPRKEEPLSRERKKKKKHRKRFDLNLFKKKNFHLNHLPPPSLSLSPNQNRASSSPGA